MKNLRLITLNPIAAPFDVSKGEAGLPKRFRVLPWGDNKTLKGQVIVNSTTLNTLPAFQVENNLDRGVVLDFEHNTVQGTAGYSPTALVAGYGPVDVVENDGVYITMSSWTDDGKRLGGGGHYANVSATVILNEDHEVVGVQSVALCRHGAARDAIFLSAWPLTEVKPPQTAEELFSALKTALGAAHDATPMQVVEVLQSKLMPEVNKETKTETKPGDEPEKKPTGSDAVSVETLSGSIKELTDLVKGQNAKIETLSGQVKSLQDNGDKSERSVVLSAAAAQGKVVPKSAEGLPLETLKSIIAELPETVPMEARTPLSTTTLSAPSAVNDDVSKLTGVSDEDRKKYSKM